MPGSIRVSVLEAVDLPAAATGKYVIIRVALGRLEFRTQPGDLEAGKTAPWNSNFNFPVTNLRDKLVVAVCNVDDEAVTQIDIEIPSIVERGYRDEFMDFKGGGRIHLILSFALTDEERRKIQIMRAAALKRREQEKLKKTVVFQAVQPRPSIDDYAATAVPRATITELDEPTKDEQENGSEQNIQAPLGLGPMSKPLNPGFGFDYAKAFGVRPINIKRKPSEPMNVGVATGVRKMVKQDSKVKVSKESAARDMDTLNLSRRSSDNLPRSSLSSLCTDSKDVSLATLAMDSSAITKSEASQDGASQCDNLLSTSMRPTPPSASTPSQQGLSTSTLPESMQGQYAEKMTQGGFQAQTIESTILHQDPEQKSGTTARFQEEVWQVENQRINDMLEAEAAAMAVGINNQLFMEDEQREKRRINKARRPAALKEQMQCNDLQPQKEQSPPGPVIGAKMEQLEVISQESSCVLRMVKVHLEMGNLESRPVVVRLEPEEHPVIRSSSLARPSGPVSISEFEQMADCENAERAFSNKFWQVLGAIADEILCTPGKVHRSGLLPGPEARWAHKRSIKSRWASPLGSPEKPGYVGTEDPSCQTPEPYRGRMRLLQLFPPIAGQEEAGGEGQSFHEHEGLAGIAAVIHKVIGGAAVLLAALFTVVAN